VGNLLLDQFPDGRVEPGGAALFTALAARQAGLRVGLHSVVGADYPLELLRKSGVQLSLTHLEGPGGRTVIRYTENQRELTHVGPGHHAMTPQTLHPFDTRLVHIAPMPWEWQRFHLEGCAPGTALLDPYPVFSRSCWLDLEPRRKYLLYLLLNQEELEIDLEVLPEDLPALVKQGAEGGYCWRTGQRWQAVDVPVVDPTGAGDSFAAGLAAGHLAGLKSSESFALGADLAARVVTDVGVRALLGSG